MRKLKLSTLAASSLLTTAFLISGCAPTQELLSDHTLEADISGLTQNKSVLPSLFYYREGAPELAEYKAFVLDPIKIRLQDDRPISLSPEELDEAKAYFYKAMESELTAGGYQVHQTKTDGAMRISFIVSDISAPNSAINALGPAVSLPITPSVGSVLVEAIFRESASDRVDAVYVEKSRGSMLFNPTPWSTLADIEATFDNWASGFRESLDRAHGK